MISKLLRTAPLISAFLIFCGTLKLIIVYSHFGIDIVNFLTVAEIITSFLDDINILIALVVTMFVPAYIFLEVTYKRSGMPFAEFTETFDSFFLKHKRTYIVFFSIALLALGGLIWFEILPLNYATISFLIFFFAQLVTHALMKKNSRGELTLSNFKGLAALLLTVIFATYMFGVHEISNLKKFRQAVTLQTKTGKIICDSKNKQCFLGKTDNYVFVHNFEKETTKVIPAKDILYFEFQSEDTK